MHYAIPSAYGPHDLGTDGWRAFYAAQTAFHMDELIDAMMMGASPADVAAYVQAQGIVSMGLSWRIEDKAEDGTFAAAVFEILAN